MWKRPAIQNEHRVRKKNRRTEQANTHAQKAGDRQARRTRRHGKKRRTHARMHQHSHTHIHRTHQHVSVRQPLFPALASLAPCQILRSCGPNRERKTSRDNRQADLCTAGWLSSATAPASTSEHTIQANLLICVVVPWNKKLHQKNVRSAVLDTPVTRIGVDNTGTRTGFVAECEKWSKKCGPLKWSEHLSTNSRRDRQDCEHSRISKSKQDFTEESK